MTGLEAGARVLYVDDESLAIQRVTTHLEREYGADVVSTPRAEEGVTRLAEESIDCVVSDYELSGTDGLAFLDRVRDRNPDLPVVVFSRGEDESVADWTGGDETAQYVHKGHDRVRTAVLGRRVDELLSRRDREASLTRLHEVATEIQTARTTDAVHELVVDTLVEDLGFDAVSVRVAEDDALALASGSDPPPRSAGELPVEGSVAGEVLSTGESRLIDDPQALAAMGFGGDYDAVLVAPLEDHGVLTAASEGRPIDDDDRDLVDLLAAHASASVGRVQRERQLQSSDARLKALSQAFPDYAFLYDEEGRYLDVLLGWELDGGRLNTVEELIGQSVHDVLPEDSARTVLDAIEEALETDALVKTKYRVDTPADPLWYEAYAAPLPDEIDDRDTVIVAARDVTARHRSQQELQRQNQRLEQFASLVSHDLRNPLSVADGYTQTAMDASDDEQVESFLEEVQYSHDRMEELINDVLTLARQGQTVTETRPVDLSAAASEAWENVETANATLAIEADGRVAADRSRILQVFENFYRNSLEHGVAPDDPGASVAVRVGALDDGFFVEDDGPGIPEDRCDEVFEDGYTTTNDGTGLGLSIVRSIVEAHGWTVTATESETGGARFEVRGVTAPE